MVFLAEATTEVGVVVGAFVTIITSFLAMAKLILNQAEKDREADRKERAEFVKALKELTSAGVRQAEATEKAAQEAENRNGHLADISLENKNQIIKAIQGIKIDKQTVHHQTVEHEKVLNKEK